VFVVATAGHVDHGKSTLVRALTGMDPDRLAEERRRGLTIELGYVWTDLPTGERVEFVDVPGHEKFLATMLAGVGPVPAVLLVVAADEGWRRQTGEHVAALDALGVTHGLVAVTRSDLADPGPALDEVRERLAGTGLAASPVVAVSALTGRGLDDLRAALGALVRGLPEPPVGWRTRLFVDRVFTVRGAGTVVTATLPAGSLAVGGVLDAGPRHVPVTVRGLECCKAPLDSVGAVARVAVNLRGAPADLRRGDALRTPGAWPDVTEVDVEVRAADPDTAPHEVPAELPADLVLHVGSASVPVRVRVLAGSAVGTAGTVGTVRTVGTVGTAAPLPDGAPETPRVFARLRLGRPLPLEPGDRGVLRDPGRHTVAAGVLVRDVDPPALDRRGAARARVRELAGTAVGDPATVVRRRGLVRRADLAVAGLLLPDGPTPPGCGEERGWVVDHDRWRQLTERLTEAVRTAPDRLGRGLPLAAAVTALALPDPLLLAPLVRDAGLVVREGRLVDGSAGPQVPPELQEALARLTARLTAQPFSAPEAGDLTAWALDGTDLGALGSLGLVLRLPGNVVLLPDAPDRAARVLAGIDQPFTLSEARQALGTSRRVAIPLLEHLDRLRLTVRDDSARRTVR